MPRSQSQVPTNVMKTNSNHYFKVRKRGDKHVFSTGKFAHKIRQSVIGAIWGKMMKQQRGFDWFKLMTISMFVLGIGGILFSLIIFLHFYLSNDFDFEIAAENREIAETPFRAASPYVLKQPSNSQSDERSLGKEVEETLPWFDSLEEEGLSNLGFEGGTGALEEDSLKEKSNAASERRYAFGLSREEAHKRGAELRVELENLLYTCLDMEADILAGVAAASKIPDKAAKEREFERLGELSDEQAELKKAILALEGDYVMLSEDWTAEQPGGWVYELKQKLHLGIVVYSN